MDAPCGCESDGESESLSLGTTLADDGASPFDQVSQRETRERVEAALREVPEAFRTVLVLREIEGFAYEEIAEILQVNLGTVKSRLMRGRAALRGLLAPAGSVAGHSTQLCAHSHPLPAPRIGRRLEVSR